MRCSNRAAVRTGLVGSRQLSVKPNLTRTEGGAYLTEGSGCSRFQPDWHCSLSPVRGERRRRDVEVREWSEEKGAEPALTDRDASLSSLYLPATPKRVLLLPAVHAKVTAVSSSSFTFW